MQSGVFGVRQELKVGYPVVGLVAVDVMEITALWDRAIRLLPEPTVLKDVSAGGIGVVGASDANVTIRLHGSATLPVRRLFTAQRLPATSVRAEQTATDLYLVGAAVEQPAARDACSLDRVGTGTMKGHGSLLLSCAAGFVSQALPGFIVRVFRVHKPILPLVEPA